MEKMSRFSDEFSRSGSNLTNEERIQIKAREIRQEREREKQQYVEKPLSDREIVERAKEVVDREEQERARLYRFNSGIGKKQETDQSVIDCRNEAQSSLEKHWDAQDAYRHEYD